MVVATETHESVREYYGRVLQRSSQLKTDACCERNGPAPHLKAIVSELAPQVVERFYGCGSPIPPAIEGCTVLDLGCGAGRDAYICSKLVGPDGWVIGVDMTEEQLQMARSCQREQAAIFGYASPNTRFVDGYLEDLAGAGIADESVDVVISNCVINLAPNKVRVFKEIFRVLKPGGELLFADVFADRRLPTEWRDDPVLLGECLAGAMYFEDFRRMLAGLGVADYRVLARRALAIGDQEIIKKVGSARFSSLTVRAFKLALEDRCEDYGQVATYRGTIPYAPHSFVLDDHHEFETGRPMLVCGNTAAMLSQTRYARHFEVTGDRSRHFGLFACGIKSDTEARSSQSGCC